MSIQYLCVVFFLLNCQYQDHNIKQILNDEFHSSIISQNDFRLKEGCSILIGCWLLVFTTQFRMTILFQTPTIISAFYYIMKQSTIKVDSMHELQIFFLMFSTISIFIQNDKILEESDRLILSKNKEVMKIIHDLKNPLIAVNMIIEESGIQNDMVCDVKSEIHEMNEMLDTLKTEFKSRNGMKFDEKIDDYKTHDLIKSFKMSFTKLAQNGGNNVEFYIQQNFPEYLSIKPTILKRIVNNLISNSLKHTNSGNVKVSFMNIKEENENMTFYRVGSIDRSKKQIIIEVKDNGKGIKPDKILKIFDELNSDQNDNNWDGIGLGLPICLKLAIISNYFIKQGSKPNEKTIFQLQIPNVYSELNKLDLHLDQISSNSLKSLKIANISKSLKLPIKESLINYSKDIHNFNQATILIAEDNLTISKNQSRLLTKYNCEHLIFNNGQFLYDQIINQDLNYKTYKGLIFVITDLNMPNLDGENLAKMLRNINGCNFYILLASAEPYEDKLQLFDFVLEKPIKISKVIEIQNNVMKYQMEIDTSVNQKTNQHKINNQEVESINCFKNLNKIQPHDFCDLTQNKPNEILYDKYKIEIKDNEEESKGQGKNVNKII